MPESAVADPVSTTGNQPTPETPATAQPTATPEPAAVDWSAHVPKDYAQDKVFERFKGKALGDVLKSFAENNRMIGGMIRLPNEKDKPEDAQANWNDIYTKLGRPSSPDQYEVKTNFPEQVPVSETHLKGFLSTFHKLGLSKNQAQGIISAFGEYLGEGVTARANQYRDGKAALEKDWGANYNANTALAQRGLAQILGSVLGDEQAKAYLDKMDKTGESNDPMTVKIWAHIGAMLREDGLLPDAGGAQPDTGAIESKIRAIYADAKHPAMDRLHPDHDKAVQELEALKQQMHNPLLQKVSA